MRQYLVLTILLMTLAALVSPTLVWAAHQDPTQVPDPAQGGGFFEGSGLSWLGGFIKQGFFFILAKIIWGINWLVGYIGSIFFVLGGLLLQLAIALNVDIIKSDLVLIGWRIVRDFANLGFVIGIIVIAFATMLRIESYGMKKTLVWFIVAAVLVNFSLAIAGVLVDVSNMFTHLFVSKAIGGGTGNAFEVKNLNRFALNLANAFSPQKLSVINQKDRGVFQALASTGAGLVTLVATSFFIAAFTVLAALSILALAVMVLYRYVWLSLLLILLPLAVLASTMPGLRKYWSGWLKAFWAQLIFLPAALFFIYLAILFVDRKAASGGGGVQGSNLAMLIEQNAGNPFGQFLAAMAQPFADISQMIVVITLLWLSMRVAKDLGGKGGEALITAGNAFISWGTGAIKAGPLGAGALALRQGLRVFGGAEKGLGAQAAQLMARIPVLRRLAAPLQKFVTAKENVERFEKEYEQMGKQSALNIARARFGELNPERRAALAKVIAKKGWVSGEGGAKGLTGEEMRPFLDVARQLGVDKELLKVVPHLVSDNEEEFKKVMEALRPKDMDTISPEALKDIRVVSRLNEAHIKALRNSGDEPQKAAFVETLLQHVDDADTEKRERIRGFAKIVTSLNATWTGIKGIKELIAAKEKWGVVAVYPGGGARPMVLPQPKVTANYPGGVQTPVVLPPPEEEPPPITPPAGGPPPTGGTPSTGSAPAGGPTPSSPAPTGPPTGGRPTPTGRGPLAAQVDRLRQQRAGQSPPTAPPPPPAPPPTPPPPPATGATGLPPFVAPENPLPRSASDIRPEDRNQPILPSDETSAWTPPGLPQPSKQPLPKSQFGGPPRPPLNPAFRNPHRPEDINPPDNLPIK